ncbi:MAG: hypothetical protein ACLQIB_52185, partial [Isosphaeraceae bacterium]
ETLRGFGHAGFFVRLNWRRSTAATREAHMKNGNFTMDDHITRAKWPLARWRTDHIDRWLAVVIGEDTLLAWWTRPLRPEASSWPRVAVCPSPTWNEFDPTGIV